MGKHIVIKQNTHEVMLDDERCITVIAWCQNGVWLANEDICVEGDIIGAGKTEQEAIDNLIEQMEGNN